MCLADACNKLQAVDSGHVEIDQRNFNGTSGNSGKRLVGVGGLYQRPVRPDAPECARHHHAGELAVINDQDFAHFQASRG